MTQAEIDPRGQFFNESDDSLSPFVLPGWRLVQLGLGLIGMVLIGALAYRFIVRPLKKRSKIDYRLPRKTILNCPHP